MNRKWVLAACAAIASAAILAVACDDDEGGGGSPTAVGTPPTSVSANITPFPTGQITDNKIVSASKGYTATMPDGWKPRFNLLETVLDSADAFFEPLSPGAQVQANIAVTCTVGITVSPDERISLEKTTTARLPTNHDIVESETTVDGAPATVLTYNQSSQQNPDQPQLAKTDIMFTGDKCAYKVTTVSALADRAKYQATFDAFVASFTYEK